MTVGFNIALLSAKHSQPISSDFRCPQASALLMENALQREIQVTYGKHMLWSLHSLSPHCGCKESLRSLSSTSSDTSPTHLTTVSETNAFGMSLELIVQALRDETGHEAGPPLQSAGGKKTQKTNKQKTKHYSKKCI